MGRTPHPTQPHKTDGGAQQRQEEAAPSSPSRRATNAPVLPTPEEAPVAAPATQSNSQGASQGAGQGASQEWTQERRDAWREWLTAQLIAAQYAAVRRGKVAFWVTDLSRATGIHKNTLLNYVRLGSQPGPAHLAPIARALGLHPLTVAYRAGHLSKDELIQLVGGGSIPSPEDMRAALVELDYLPDSMAQTREVLRATTEYTLAMVDSLAQQLGLSPEEFGPVAAEVVKREIIADHTPFTTPDPADVPPGLDDDTSTRRGSVPRREYRPGPVRNRAPQPGADAPDEDL